MKKNHRMRSYSREYKVRNTFLTDISQRKKDVRKFPTIKYHHREQKIHTKNKENFLMKNNSLKHHKNKNQNLQNFINIFKEDTKGVLEKKYKSLDMRKKLMQMEQFNQEIVDDFLCF